MEDKLHPIWVSLTLAVTFVVLVFGLSETRHLVRSFILRRHFAQALQLLLGGLVLFGIFGFGFRGIWPWADLDTELYDSALLMGCGFIFSRELIFFKKRWLHLLVVKSLCFIQMIMLILLFISKLAFPAGCMCGSFGVGDKFPRIKDTKLLHTLVALHWTIPSLNWIFVQRTIAWFHLKENKTNYLINNHYIPKDVYVL